jgi:hypothetical protein
MTDRKDFKRRVRERQARTGESYTTARMQVESRRPGAVPVVETIDVAEAAARLGLRCHVVIASTLLDLLDGELVLERIRDALIGTDSDPATELMRAVALRGENPLGVRRHPLMAGRLRDWNDPELRQFIARARAGIGGVSERHHVLALTIRDVMALCWLTTWPVNGPDDRTPALYVSTVDGNDEAIVLSIRARRSAP